MQKLFQW